MGLWASDSCGIPNIARAMAVLVTWTNQGAVLMPETLAQEGLSPLGVKRAASWTLLQAAGCSPRPPHSEDAVHAQKTNGTKDRQLIFSAGGRGGMWVSGRNLCLSLRSQGVPPGRPFRFHIFSLGPVGNLVLKTTGNESCALSSTLRVQGLHR